MSNQDSRVRLHSSKSNEWYTPAIYVEAARQVLGGIDLDPASSAEANRTVRATCFYTAADDGLAQQWQGRIWLNPPYGRTRGKSNQELWSRRLIADHRAGYVTAAVLLVNAVPGNRWFAPLWDFPLCFVGHRIRFELPGGMLADAPTHSNVLAYLGPERDCFVSIFSQFGTVAERCERAQLDIQGSSRAPASRRRNQQPIMEGINNEQLSHPCPAPH